MPDPISAITSIPGLEPLKPIGQPTSAGGFGDVLEGTLKTLGSVQDTANTSVQKFLTGENEELHSTVLAVQKAEIAFDLGLQVRNKVVSAYQEIMRMQM
jgi:flagellar hook-basal body complex protein FliE